MARHETVSSMSRRGKYYDNAHTESFWNAPPQFVTTSIYPKSIRADHLAHSIDLFTWLV